MYWPPARPRGRRLRWAGGQWDLPWDDVYGIRQLPLPDLGQEVALKDGSRIRGWVLPSAAAPELASCLIYSANWTAFTEALENEETPPLPTARQLRTSDKSLIIGGWGQDEVAVASPTGTLRVPVSDIRRIQIEPDISEGPVSVEITTAQGSVIRGIAGEDALLWKHGAMVLKLPWPLISDIVIPETPAAKP